MKKYCMKCGSPTDFSMIKPKFCSSCGNSFEIGLGVDIIPQAKKSFTKIPQPPENIADIDYDDDNDEVTEVPNISEINCDYEVKKHQGVKFKSIIDNPIPPSSVKASRPKGKKMSKKEVKEFLDSFKKEAGSIRPKK